MPVLNGILEKPISVAAPATLREGKLSPWWPQYEEAIQAEYDGLLVSGTWILIPLSKVPYGANILRGKWILDDKRGEDGKILKYKARFVAMGNTQKYQVDYDETFAGVVVAKSFRIMLSILNESPTNEMEHWDVKMAFTQAFLDEEIFMHEPEGYESKGEKMVCLLKKSLYGLKQSARNWQLMLRNFFVQNGFFSVHADPCVYFLREGDAWCMVSTHVDDIFVLHNEAGKFLRDKLFSSILLVIPIENLGNVSWALKTAVLRDRATGVLKISQEQYTQEYLAKSALSKDNKQFPSIKSPASNPNFPENYAPDSSLDRLDETLKKQFQSDIGAFWWLAQISRPDIFYAVHRCSKLVNKPNARLGQRIQKIKDYLVLTPSVGIVFQRHLDSPTLSGYVDAAFASEDQAASRIGYFFLFRGNLVSWCSENTTRVMTSSTEVECRGLVQFGKENQWHRQFHSELNLFSVAEATVAYEDNTASIHLSSDLGTPHKKSKHFGIEWSFYKESVQHGELAPVYVSTDLQPADMLTKALLSPKFAIFRDMVMGDSICQDHFSFKPLVTHACILDHSGDHLPPRVVRAGSSTSGL